MTGCLAKDVYPEDHDSAFKSMLSRTSPAGSALGKTLQPFMSGGWSYAIFNLIVAAELCLACTGPDLSGV